MRSTMESHESDTKPRKRFLSKPAVLETTTWSSAHLYREVHAGRFPAPVRISENRVAWVEEEVAAWVDERIAARDRGGAAA